MKKNEDNPNISWVEIKRLWPFFGFLILATTGYVSLKQDMGYIKDTLKEFAQYKIRNEIRLGSDEIKIAKIESEFNLR